MNELFLCDEPLRLASGVRGAGKVNPVGRVPSTRQRVLHLVGPWPAMMPLSTPTSNNRLPIGRWTVGQRFLPQLRLVFPESRDTFARCCQRSRKPNVVMSGRVNVSPMTPLWRGYKIVQGDDMIWRYVLC